MHACIETMIAASHKAIQCLASNTLLLFSFYLFDEILFGILMIL